MFEDFNALFAYKDSIVLCDIIAIVYVVDRAGLYRSTFWQGFYLATQSADSDDIIAPVMNPCDIVRFARMCHIRNDLKHNYLHSE